jgi:hypothetical protein
MEQLEVAICDFKFGCSTKGRRCTELVTICDHLDMKPVKRIDPLILSLRGQKVILDVDLAELYGVATKVLNQAVKRNADRFPEDFMFQLTAKEWSNLRSQIATSSLDVPQTEGVAPNWSQFVTTLI